MAKVLVFGDTHFRESAYLQGEELIEKGVKLAQKLKPDVTIVLGDLCDEHETLRTAPAKQVERFLRGLIDATSGMVYALMGNHDLIDNRQFLSENHFFGPYKEWEGLVIVDKPIIAYVGGTAKRGAKRGVKLVLCPFVEKGRFVEALDTLLYDIDPDDLEEVEETGEDWKDARCVFGHLEAKGVTYAGRVSTNGDKWSAQYPMLISGHIHDACFIEPNVHYPGSSIQVAANEKPDKRVWLLTFSEDGDSEPKIRKYDLGLKTIKEVALDCADAKTFDWSLTEKYVIKLVLSGTQEELSLFRKSQLYAKFKRLGVRVGFSTIVDESPVFLLTAGDGDDLSGKKKQNPETMTFDQILRRLCRTKPDSVKQVYEKICGEDVDSESNCPDQGSDSDELSASDQLSASEIDSAEFVFSDSDSDDEVSSE